MLSSSCLLRWITIKNNSASFKDITQKISSRRLVPSSSSSSSSSSSFSSFHGLRRSRSSRPTTPTTKSIVRYSSSPSFSFSSSSPTSSSLFSLSSITSLYDAKIHLPSKPDFSDPRKNYEPSTPLGEEIMKYIGVLGAPITLAEYMEICLRDEQYGYYTNPPLVAQSQQQQEDDGDDDFDFSNSKEQDNSLLNLQEGRGHRLIGKAGDFTTAPEISQIFGECVTIWLLTQYEALGKPSMIQLVELGPGRGTLMCDILKSAKSIKGTGEDFIRALAAGGGGSGSSSGSSSSSSSSSSSGGGGVHFVEISENLRISQREALQKLQTSNEKDLSGLSFDFVPWKTRNETLKQVDEFVAQLKKVKSQGGEITVDTLSDLWMVEKQQQQQQQQPSSQQPQQQQQQPSSTNTGKESVCTIPIHWHSNLESVPWKRNVFISNDKEKDDQPIPTFIICQEFFDALPVHVFQKTQNGWREQMVDVAMEDEDEKEQETDNKVIVQMRDGTFAKTKAPSTTSKSTSTTATATATQQLHEITLQNDKKKPRFRHVLSPGITPALRALLHLDDDGNPRGSKEQVDTLTNAPVGTILEVCPEGLALVQDIALRIEACRGAAIIFDYGDEGSRDTMRAFRKHEQVDVLSSPGTVDVTADVDFGALKNAVNIDLRVTRSKNGENDKKDASRNLPFAFGPKTQGHFLASMGAVERTIQLIEDDSTTDEQAEELCTALERLMSKEEMGERFKVLAIAHKKDGIFAPAGF